MDWTVMLLIPGACEHVALCGKKYFACDLEMGDYPGFSRYAEYNRLGSDRKDGRRIRASE
jgi:hypothetical protein